MGLCGLLFFFLGEEKSLLVANNACIGADMVQLESLMECELSLKVRVSIEWTKNVLGREELFA